MPLFILSILSPDGSVWTAGRNARGQLSGDTVDRPTFTKVLGVEAVKEIAAGYEHCVVLTVNDEVTILIVNHPGAGIISPPSVNFFFLDICNLVKCTISIQCFDQSEKINCESNGRGEIGFITIQPKAP